MRSYAANSQLDQSVKFRSVGDLQRTPWRAQDLMSVGSVLLCSLDALE